MTIAQAPTAPAATPAPSFEKNAGKLTDRIVADIPDDFDLGDGPEPSPDTSKPTSLEEDDFDDDGGEPTKPETPAPKKKEAEKPKTPPKPKDEPAEPEPAAEESKAAKSALPADKGTEDEPYTVKDLPEDRYVRIKVDGEERTLPLREMADGYIRKQTMDRGLSVAKQAAADAERIAKTHIAERTKLRADVDAFLGDPERMFTYLLERDPDVLLQLGERIGNQYGAWQKDPSALQRHNYERQQRQIAAERKRVEQERQQWEQERTTREASERTNQVWAPIWKDALKAAGFPENTPKFQRTVKALVKVAQDENGGKLTAEMFRECVVEAAKLSKAKTVEQRQPPEQPAPAPKPRAPKAEAEPAVVSHARKFRDPNFLLR